MRGLWAYFWNISALFSQLVRPRTHCYSEIVMLTSALSLMPKDSSWSRWCSVWTPSLSSGVCRSKRRRNSRCQHTDGPSGSRNAETRMMDSQITISLPEVREKNQLFCKSMKHKQYFEKLPILLVQFPLWSLLLSPSNQRLLTFSTF